MAQNYPMSDPNNSGGWILNEHMSDEFNGGELNRDKWWILGEDISGVREYRNKWKGRAPGQFVGHNVFLENGELVLRSQWEPSFQFANEKHAASGTWYGGSTTAADNSQPITQSCILSEGMFKYGYVEARYKAADAPVTNAVWTTGYRSEIDMTENFGKRPIGNPENKPESLERKYRTNIISWEPNLPSDHKNWKVEKDMGVRLSEDYHVYGFEWDKDYVKTYFDGELVQSISRVELENWQYATGKYYNQWLIKHPMELWLDAEVFSWYGLPKAQDLETPADHRYDYIRIWQKELSGPEYYANGFEGPFYYKYGNQNHKRSINWWAPGNSPFVLTDEKAASGDISLGFLQTGTISANQTIFAPYGSLNLPGGSNSLTFKVWKKAGSSVNKIYFNLKNPFLTIYKDISGIETEKWVKLSIPFSRDASIFSGNADRLEIQIRASDVSGTNNTIYIDDIVFENDNNTITRISEINKKEEIKIFPNPGKNVVNVAGTNVMEVSIFGLQGNLIRKYDEKIWNGRIDISDFSNGMYVMSVQTVKGLVNKKLQIIR